MAGCVLTALCGEPDNATRIVAIAGAVVSAISYVFGKASIDKAAVASEAEALDSDVIGFTVNENFE